MDGSNESIKRTLMELRQSTGKTQQELADLVGVSAQTISNWERGIQAPRLTFQQTDRLMKALNVVNLEELIRAFDQTMEERKRRREKTML